VEGLFKVGRKKIRKVGRRGFVIEPVVCREREKRMVKDHGTIAVVERRVPPSCQLPTSWKHHAHHNLPAN
jgi:hypothetical protein